MDEQRLGKCVVRRTRRIRAIVLKASALAVALFVTACGSPMKQIDAGNAPSVIDDFSKGRIVLSTGPGGIANYVQNRPGLHVLYAAGDWSTLAKQVIQIDYGNDLDWYYLGVAAEKLGFADAAKTYYLNASTTNLHCGGHLVGNDCGGLSLPDVVIAGIARLSAPQTSASTAAPRTPMSPIESAAEAAAASLATARSSGSPSWQATDSAPAQRQAPASPPSGFAAVDVLGIRLGMNPAEVRSVLVSNGYRVDTTTTFYHYLLNGNIGFDKSRSMIAMIEGELTRNNDPRLPKETVHVVFTAVPGGEQAFAIHRLTSYAGTAQPGVLLSDLKSALIAKYGAPIIDDAFGIPTRMLYWSTLRSPADLKVWFNEPRGAGVAYTCGTRAFHQPVAGLHPLDNGVYDDPILMADHCGKAFMAVNMGLSSTLPGRDAGNVVTQYELAMLDTVLAKAGKDRLLEGNAQASTRPRL